MLVRIRVWINDEPRLSLPKPIYQNRQLGRMMIKHPDGHSLQGLGPLLHRGLRLDLIGGVFSKLQEDKETNLPAGFLSLLGDKSCSTCTWKSLSVKPRIVIYSERRQKKYSQCAFQFKITDLILSCPSV